MLRLTFPVGSFEANCTLLQDEDTRRTFIIDPGADAAKVVRRLENIQAEPAGILCTHAHIDHVNAVAELAARYPGVPVVLHPDDRELMESIPLQGRMFGMRTGGVPVVTRWTQDGDTLALGAQEVRVIHTPGHSPGSVSFMVLVQGVAHIVCGDTVFAGGIGRTDLWGGSYATLLDSIKSRLFAYPDQTVLVPGHGEETTIGREKTCNPFLVYNGL